MSSEPPRRRSRIADELDRAHPVDPDAGNAKKRGFFGTIKHFFKDLLVRQTSTKR